MHFSFVNFKNLSLVFLNFFSISLSSLQYKLGIFFLTNYFLIHMLKSDYVIYRTKISLRLKQFYG